MVETVDPKASKAIADLVTKSLAKFIELKLREYVEPTRIGTPKGELVGFSRAKYKAMLYALRETEDLEAQAKELGVSYGLLRKWRSEDQFKQLKSEHEMELTNSFLACMRAATGVAGSDPELRILELIKDLTRGNVLKSKGQKEALRLMILVHRKLRRELTAVNPPVHDIQRYQRLALDLATALLQDRQKAIKNRNDIIMLLSGVRETLG